MEQFILSYTWFALNYILRILGLNLFKRDDEAGLRPTSACQFWLPLACTYLVSHGSIYAIYCYIFIFETTLEEFLREVNERIYTSTTTTFAIWCDLIITHGLNLIGVFKLRALSKGLIFIQEYFNQNTLINERVTKKGIRNSLWRSLPFMAIMLIGQCLGWLGIIKLGFSRLNVSTFLVNMLVLFTSLFILVCIAPIWYFVFIYIEVSLTLNKQKSGIVNIIT